MKASDKTIVLGAGLLVLVAAFYLLLLAPKRDQAAELGDEIISLQSSISEQEQVATFAEQARHDFPRYYGRLVVLGKAVPEQADTASMLVEVSSIAAASGVDFRGIKLNDSGAGAGTTAAQPATPPATPAPTGTAAGATPTATASTPTTTGSSSATPTSTAAPAPTAAPATEASAATLPIGAVVGPAGLPTLPYELSFKGGFFGIADYLGGLDGLVQMRDGGSQVAANGRLITVDGFSLKGGLPGTDPVLDATFTVTTYVTPTEQGLTVGATPTGPAPTTTQPVVTAASAVAQ